MKKIFKIIFIVLLFSLIACGKKEDIWVGSWITPEWKDVIENVEIKREENGSYLITISDSIEEFKFYGKTKEKGKILEVNNGVFTLDFTQNPTTKELMFAGKTYPKLDEKLSKEIDSYIENMRESILGKWRFEEIRKYGKNPLIDEYILTVTKLDRKNCIMIKTESIRNRGRENEERKSIEGKFEILSTGKFISLDEGVDVGKFFPRDRYLYAVKRFKDFERIGD